MLKRLTFLAALLALNLGNSTCPGGGSKGTVGQKPSEIYVNARQIMADARSRVEGYVLAMKTAYKGKENEAVYRTAERMYEDTVLAKYSAWLSSTKISLIAGEDLSASAAYKGLCDKAGEAATTFVKYCQDNGNLSVSTVQAIGVADIAKALVDSGISIWKAIKERQDSERKAVADALQTELAWHRWADVK